MSKKILFSILAFTLSVTILTPGPSQAASVSRQIIDTTDHVYPENGESILIKNIDQMESRVIGGAVSEINYEHLVYVWVRGDLGEQTDEIELLMLGQGYAPVLLRSAGPAQRFGPDPAVGDEYFVYQLRVPVNKYNYATYMVRAADIDGSSKMSPKFTVHNQPNCEETLTK